MRAVCWTGIGDVSVETVPDPKILDERDAILRITSTAICGSDLDLYDGYIPAMKKGDILGHECMGEVVELGSEVKNLNQGDRVVVPFNISCGACFFCRREEWSLCEEQPQLAGARPRLRLPRRGPVRVLAGELRHRVGGHRGHLGAGPVGQMATVSAYLLGAERVIVIDRIPERLRMAKEKSRGRGREL